MQLIQLFRTFHERCLSSSWGRAKVLTSPECRQGTGQGEQEEGGGEGGEGRQGDEGREGPDWMGRIVPGFSVEVLSPSKAAKREKIVMLPGWMRALKPWGDVLQVKFRCLGSLTAIENSRQTEPRYA